MLKVTQSAKKFKGGLSTPKLPWNFNKGGSAPLHYTPGSEWPEEFGKHEVNPPEKPVTDMSKEEYQAYAEIMKAGI